MTTRTMTGKYSIIRVYRNEYIPSRTIRTSLTLEEAKAYCKDKETSSSTCKGAAGTAHTEEFGAWFDGFDH